MIEEQSHITKLSIEDCTKEHRASIRKMVWSKIILGLSLSLLGWILPFMVKIHYIPYFGNALKFTALVLLIQGFRTLRAYSKINRNIVPKSSYADSDLKESRDVVTLQIEQNTLEQRVALIGLIIAVVVSVITVLSQNQVFLPSLTF